MLSQAQMAITAELFWSRSNYKDKDDDSREPIAMGKRDGGEFTM
jgi:hypothetical protein